MSLPTAPRHIVDAHGMPQLGRFAGLAGHIDWSGLAAPYGRSSWWRRFHHKRWHYVALSAGEIFCGLAIVDLGWTSTAFAYVFDRSERKVIAAFSQDGLPGLSADVAHHAGQGSSFSFAGKQIHIHPDGRLHLRAKDFAIDARFAGNAPQLLAVGTVQGGSVHATQKSTAMALNGELHIEGRRIVLDGGVASVDYSNGLLARDTAWRWASAHSMEIGFNLQAGYFGANENALWLDGQLFALGAAHFDYDSADPLAPWHVSTEDGLLDLHFVPEGARHEDKNLVIAASRYVQPIGTFSGTVRSASGAPVRRVAQLVGVTEDHASRW
jgi:hypothetical protein